MASEGDYLREVQPGEVLDSIPRDAYNEFIRAARANRNRGKLGDGTPTFSRQPAIVTVRNSTGDDVGQWGVLTLGGAVIAPADNQAEFERGVLVEGLTPGSAVDVVCITLEPIADGKLGRAVVTGAVPALLDVADESHKYAYPADGETGFLRTGRAGPARIIYKEPEADADAEGLRQGYVLLGAGGAPGPWVRCEKRLIHAYCSGGQFFYNAVFDYIDADDRIVFTRDEPCSVSATFAGVANGTCSSCSTLNSAHTLERDTDTTWSGGGGAVCGTDTLNLSLTLSGSTLTLTIAAGSTTIATYTNGAAGGYDGSGSIVLTKVSNSGACGSWPTTVTLGAA